MSRDIGDITAERLSNDPGLQLLQNTVATAGVLVALILALGPASGCHFNPAVTLVDPFFGGLDTPTALGYVAAQVAGAIAGAVTANLMFHLPAVTCRPRNARPGTCGSPRASPPMAAAGDLRGRALGPQRCRRLRGGRLHRRGVLVHVLHQLRNPAVTIGRAFSDTFAGIEPASVPMFIVAQLVGAGTATGLVLVIYPHIGDVADRVVVPHEPREPTQR
jgi:glycerol uptake facilitator-like aquaporin